MDRMLYIAMSGASETMRGQTTHSNNLANVRTTGFRADFEQARSMPVFGPGAPSRVYAMEERPATDFSSGPLITTDRDLDVAVRGAGWIGVQSVDGSEAYTRAGNLHFGEGGLLMTAQGQPVMGDDGPIVLPPADKVEIGEDGTISIVPAGQSVEQMAVINRIKLTAHPAGGMDKGADGLMRARDGEPLEADGAVRVERGALESSNVNAVSAMTEIISLSRQFEMQIKMMKSAEEMDSKSAQILQGIA
ncbi:flagellar basal body rod protein FlgF [Pelagibaculum spongiae]|uniref:Flagellar basal-body rod protein FlgF n=1 Tax=Pelagibaculum spongiae TaxID=2080658 RepID=A0A2V1GYA3_9GAMM|nr:flagellar basal body rod protein FlgF [Pelagibaculum spongiae]PVZ66743.1 flagellar biosynthesis protein FlgF [Pelagibaculum spongiae]